MSKQVNTDEFLDHIMLAVDKPSARQALYEHMQRLDAWLAENREYLAGIVQKANDPRLTEYWRHCEACWSATEDEREQLEAAYYEKRPWMNEDSHYLDPLLDVFKDPVLDDDDLDAIYALLADEVRDGAWIEKL